MKNRTRLCGVAILSALAPLATAAQSTPEPASEPTPAALPVPEAAAPPPSAVATAWEGAIGFNTGYRPEYSGANNYVVKLTPALFLRYGRFTITNASGFVTRRADDVVRGLGMDLLNDERFRANLALRIDAGRGENASAALTGLGDIKPTVRARVNLGWRFPGPWRLGASWSVDMLGRGGGNLGDVSVGWEQREPGGVVLTAGLVLSAAGDRYMQTYYGISEEQAARTGYPVYQPKSGLRDVGLNLGFRTELGPEWIWLGGAGVTRLLGPAASSPLTGKLYGWGVNTGLAWRF